MSASYSPPDDDQKAYDAMMTMFTTGPTSPAGTTVSVGSGNVITISGTSTSPNNMPKQKQLHIGDMVRITGPQPGVAPKTRHLSFVPEMIPFIGETVAITRKESPHAYRLGINSPYGYAWDVTWFELITEAKKVGKPIALDLTPFDQLVMDKTTKDEIIAVLRQHEHSKKIFEDWGLGELIPYGRGMTYLFYGGPGTGKTWAAHCMAKATGKELLTIGAAEIWSSEPGASNRAIQAAFQEAKKSNKILFIDECDSLVSSRDGAGMVIGAEINTLLTEIEKFEGVLVLATNRIEHLDAALERRISLIVEFPDPDLLQRTEIWKKLTPAKMPLEKGMSFDKLGEYKLTGGQIKNCILQAARLAVADGSTEVKASHIAAAITRMQASKNLMGTASHYNQVIKVSRDIDRKIDVVTDVKKQ